MATVTYAQADQFSLLKQIQAYVSEAEGRPPRGALVPFQTSYAIATTQIDNADDDSKLLWFPAGIWLVDLAIRFPTKIDAHATPQLVWDLVTKTAAGVADTLKIISASAKGAADLDGDRIDDAAVGAYVGERYLTFDPTNAAATPTAGTMILTAVIARGVATNKLPSITLDAIT